MTGSATVTVDPLPVAAGTITGTASVCQGATAVAYSVPVITNATSYEWVYTGTGATINGTTRSVTINFAANATSGNLTVRGVNSCGNGTVSANYAITVNSLPAAAGTITGSAAVCRGTSSVAYSVPAIANATSYSWSYTGTGATISGTSNSVTVSFSASATSGNLTVRGVNSCGEGTVSPNFSVTVNALPTVNAGIDQTIPNGTSTTLTGTVTGTGPFTYSWTPAAQVTSPTAISTTTTNLAATTVFTLTAISSTTTCSNSDQVTVNVTGGALSASATATPNTVCAGSSVQLAANASGGSGSYTYAWTSNPAGFTSGSASPTVTPLVNTIYYVAVNDGFSTVNSQVSVTVNAIPTITGTTPATRCGPGTVTLGATASAGTINWYSASTGGSSLGTGTSFTTPVISATTTYYVDATNNGCTTAARTAVTATVNALPVVNAGLDQTIPNGTSTTLTGTVTGTGPFTYSWTPAAQVTSPTAISTTTTNLAATTVFTLTAISSTTTCSNSDQVTVNVTGGALSASATATPNTVCAGSSVQLAANASGGSGSYTYAWTSNPAGFTSGSASPTVTPLVNTIYYVAVNDGFSTVNSQVSVTVNAIPTITGTTPATRCGPGTVTLGATASAGTINWYSASTGGSSLGTGTSFTTPSISSTTTYYVDATNNGCTTANRTAVTATINALPVVNAGIDQAIPNGTSTTLTGVVTGTGPFTYSWTPAAQVTSPTAISTTTSNLTATTVFTLTATSTTTTCSNSDQVTVSVTGGGLSASASATPSSVCAGTSVQLDANATGGSGSYTYAWTSNPAGFTSSSASPTVIPSVSTTYSVAVNDGFSTVNSQVSVTVNAIPATPTVSVTQPTCAVATGTITVTSPTATGMTYSINGTTYTNTTGIFSGVAPGDYNVTVRSAAGCISPGRAVTVDDQPPTPSVSNQTASIASGGTFTVTPTGVPTGTTYTWPAPTYTNGVTGGTAQTTGATSISGTLTIPTGSGTAVYTVTPTTGTCVGNTFTVTVTVSSSCVPVTITSHPSSESMCAGGNATMSVVAGGTSPFTYQWQYNNGTAWVSVANGTPAGATYANAPSASLNISGITSTGSYQSKLS